MLHNAGTGVSPESDADDGGCVSDRNERLLGHLARADGWMTAAELSDRLGVSTRSVRSYVTALKASAAPHDVVESSTSGYRLDRDAYADFIAQSGSGAGDAESPRDRLYHLIRRLADAPNGLDLHLLAESLFVSDSTIEADLRKLRAELEGTGLRLARQGATVRLTGPEQALRMLLSRLFRDEEAHGFLELASIEREFASSDLGAFKTDLIAMLDAHGYFVNEYGINNVLLHVAIAVDRTRTVRPTSDGAAEGVDEISSELAGLAIRHFGTALQPDDLEYLALLLTTRVITRGYPGAADASAAVDHEVGVVRAIVERVGEEYLVDLDDEDFVIRLSLHLHNLLARAKHKSYSRNPMSRSIKTAYPMIYEVAVFIASEVQRREGIHINDDEISYIALHVGSHLERRSKREERVTCAIVCPNYYDMHVMLRHRIEALLGDELQVDIVITRTDVDWSHLASDIVITTIESGSFAPNVVTIRPFITENDVADVRRAIARVRRQRRRMRLADELLVFFDESLFLRNVVADDETAMIRSLGARMIDAGVITSDYVDGAIERERMSSTAFTETLAVPHAMSMTATRTAICIAVNETPMWWGGNRVNVIALIAFSASDRDRFQRVFDQFVSVFADRADAQQLVRNGVDLPSFIDEIVHAIDR